MSTLPFDEPTVRKLILAWQQTRDDTTFAEIVRASEPLLRKVLWQRCGYYDEDLRQRMLIKMHRILPAYDEQRGSSGGYLNVAWQRFLNNCLLRLYPVVDVRYVIRGVEEEVLHEVAQEQDGLRPEELTRSDRWDLLSQFPCESQCDTQVLLHWMLHCDLPYSTELVVRFDHQFSLMDIRATRRRLQAWLEQRLREEDAFLYERHH